jgi:ubiquitin carboxyl-terminal hydrolase MINDY-1/2
MSSDPSPHLPSPVAPPGAAEADPHHLPQPAEPHEVMHRTRAVDFLGRRTPIVYQNDNGPCPLLAICELSPSSPSFDSVPSRVRRVPSGFLRC